MTESPVNCFTTAIRHISPVMSAFRMFLLV